ncbi:MAG: type IV secretory system conjugative DNA transfer family protein [Acidobacteriota bacterium]|nr:type IV secretory system conjugative DNA transfer family protein [Acidobacteriota bacterium]
MSAPHQETLYRLPSYRPSTVQGVLLGTFLLLLLDILIALSAAASLLARRWHYLPALGRPWICWTAYPHRLFLVGAVVTTGAAALLLLGRRRSLTPMLLPGLVLLYLLALQPLYSPASYFRWTSRYQHVARLAPDLALARRVFATALGLLVSTTSLYAAARLKAQRETGDTHGSSHWASSREVRQTELLGTQPGVVVGAWEDGRGRLHTLRDTRDRHVLVFAPSGSGKSTCLVIPTLLEWPHSVVVLDIKGELWHRTAGFRATRLGQRCLRFDPTAADGSSARYNPLSLIPCGPEDVKHAQGVADVLCDPQGRDQPRSFWDLSAHALLVGTILHVLYSETDKSLAGCARLLSDPERPIQQALEDMLVAEHDPNLKRGWVDPMGHPTPTHPVVAATARALLDMDPRTSSGVVATAQSHLHVFRDPILAANTSVSDFEPLDLVLGEPVSLYLTISPGELDRLRGPLRLLLNQFCRRLTERLDFDADSARPANRTPLLLLLDEFTALGKLDFFGRALAYLRGYGIRVFVSIQALAQLFDVYGRHQSISANCGVQIAYAPVDLETSELLSRMTGPMTVNLTKRSLSGSAVALGPRRSTLSYQEISRPLLTSEETRRLPDDEALLFIAGHPPIRGRRVPYFRVPELAKRAAIPPPEVSSRLPKRQSSPPAP